MNYSNFTVVCCKDERKGRRENAKYAKESFAIQHYICCENALGGGAEEEVGAGDAEEEVGSPGGEDRGEGVDVAEGFEDEGYDVVDNGEADGGGDSGEGAFFAHR